MDFIEELRWRGMLHDMVPGIQEALHQKPNAGYIGFDPTADSLHVGNLVQIMTLAHFQRMGHKPIVLVGGASGMVGDPSGKSAERNLLSQEALMHNVKALEQQLKKFLNFNCGPNSAEIVNNYEWLKDFRFLDFIREVGKHITVNYMMAKDAVKRRLESESGISFTEFSYQLIQGYDFYWLWKEKNCQIQMGGSDQWGNILTGVEFIRRKGGGAAFALTTPLLKKADGSKFGKTESGNIWLDPRKTSPYKFYQFWLNASDTDAKNWIRVFTSKSKVEVESIEAEHLKAPHLRLLQQCLAQEVTTITHSPEACQTAIKTSDFLFGKGSISFLHQMTEAEIIDVFEGVPIFHISLDRLTQGIPICELLVEQAKIFSSKSEATRMIRGGGVAINKERIADPTQTLTANYLVQGKYMIVQKGKKDYALIIAKGV